MNTTTNHGAFEWQRRMGVHEAYHQNKTNRLIHWFCIPFELFALVAIFSMVPLPFGLDLGLVLIVLLAPIYLATDLLLGALMTAFLAGLWWLAHRWFPVFANTP
ncbi:MAG: hypothetical protein C4K60_21045 [Ideonella sp. MAG2]|nr:MAG: hypothetical protein C4K60_21045 [Ideonella sp. MAG2]